MTSSLSDALQVFSYSHLFDTCILEKMEVILENHGKIMKFDSEIRLENLKAESYAKISSLHFKYLPLALQSVLCISYEIFILADFH